MDARLQRRVQRYGWDLAATDYEPLWRGQLEAVQSAALERAALKSAERVLDIACGPGWVTLAAARAVGPAGRVVGVDLSGDMVGEARRAATAHGIVNVDFMRADAESLALDTASVDVVLCSLGLMYVPDPARAMGEMQRVLRPGGRLVLAVWGERGHCGWAPVFEIVQREVASEVCPLFFRLGAGDALAALCRETGFREVEQLRLNTTLAYTDADAACRAAFVGGPVALAWSRFDAATRARVCDRYLDSLAGWAHGTGYRVPAEFVVVSACVPGLMRASSASAGSSSPPSTAPSAAR